MSSSSQLNAILEVEVRTLNVKHGELQTAYLELQKKYSQVLHQNETLLTKISEIKEEKWIVEQENDAFLLEALALLEMLTGKELLGKQEIGLLGAEQKFKVSENLNSELRRVLDALKNDFLESSKMNEDLEKKIFEISRENTTQNKEIECLREANMKLVGEFGKLHEEIEEQQIRESCLISELQEKDYEFGLWEAEAATFYFDFLYSRSITGKQDG
ncbi:hypothetical protein RND71_015704 [Anisodus tanguticus]|uniref:Uncharacterized protein n=1 Tax=Anisodus tanguticus TaxID=243964 RepID=A0AAE1VHY2_9SOLA|nr:hypothetical protein RND71_015704 [Anisodus tanguticus]